MNTPTPISEISPSPTKKIVCAVPFRLLPHPESFKKIIQERPLRARDPESALQCLKTIPPTDRIAIEAALSLKDFGAPGQVELHAIIVGHGESILFDGRRLISAGFTAIHQAHCPEETLPDDHPHPLEAGHYLKNHPLYGLGAHLKNIRPPQPQDPLVNRLEDSPYYLQAKAIARIAGDLRAQLVFCGAFDNDGFSGYGSAIAQASSLMEISAVTAVVFDEKFTRMTFLKDSPQGLGKFSVAPDRLLVSFAPSSIIKPRDLFQESPPLAENLQRHSLTDLGIGCSESGRYGNGNEAGILFYESRRKRAKKATKITFGAPADIDRAVDIFLEKLDQLGVRLSPTSMGESSLAASQLLSRNHAKIEGEESIFFSCHYHPSQDEAIQKVCVEFGTLFKGQKRLTCYLFTPGENISRTGLKLPAWAEANFIPLTDEEKIKHWFLEHLRHRPRLSLGFTLDTPLNREIGEWVASGLKGRFLTHCQEIAAAEGEVRVTRPLFSKGIEEVSRLDEEGCFRILALTTTHQLRGFPNVLPASEKAGALYWIDLQGFLFQPRLAIETLNIRNPEIEEISLKEAFLVVGGGYGIGKENFPSFANSVRSFKIHTGLSAALGASKIATDNGWVGSSRLVGLTGVTIDSEIYIAVGISGAMQHLVGVNAGYVITFNKSENAFQGIADLAIIGDYRETWPLFYERLSARVGRSGCNYRALFQNQAPIPSGVDWNLPLSPFLSKQVEKTSFNPDMMGSHIFIRKPLQCATDCVPEKVGIYAKGCTVVCRAQNFLLDDQGAMRTFEQEGRRATIYEGCYQCGACIQVCPVETDPKNGEKNLDWRKPSPGHQLVLRLT